MTRRRVIGVAGAIGVLGAAATALGFATEPTQAAFSYLTAWAFALSLALGALIFLMIGHAVNARWTIPLQRITESVTGALPVLAVLFVPIALALPHLYPWAAPTGALDPEVAAKLAHKAPYLNPTFWIVRAVIFLAVWVVIGELLAAWARRFARDAELRVRARALAAAGLPALGLTLTFASFDWLMSLTPLWYSTVFGLLYFAGAMVGGLSLIAVIAYVARRVPAVAAHVHPSHTGALGRLIFTFLVFWGYMELSQGLIIWIANKPDEVPWYVARGAREWGSVFTVIVIGHFALPFLALLSKPLKRRPFWLAVAGGWLLLMHYIDIYWLIMPVLHRALAIHWLDVAAPCAVLGATVAIASGRTRARQAIATDDPNFAAATAYEGS